MGDDAKGIWVEQLTTVAKTLLLVYKFIMHLDKPRTKEIPIIPPIEEYVKAAHYERFELKHNYVAICEQGLEAHTRRIYSRQSPLRHLGDEKDEQKQK